MTRNNTEEGQNQESVVEIELETVVERIMDEFEYVASITIDHLLNNERPSSITIRVYTGEADGLEDYLQLFSSDHKIAVDRGDETLLVPFSIFATFDGPVTLDRSSQTTIYMNDNILGAQSLQLEDGIAYVQDKLEQPEQWEQDPETMATVERIRDYAD